MGSLRIADVAERAGVTTATVRYYERIGVLPRAARAANGYRTYDDCTVDRLRFVARAKQLGGSLDEIPDLVKAWEGGECGPVQDRLRTVVADKLAETHREIAELVALAADLQRAAAALERHRPDGACDDRCGCATEPIEATPTFAVALTARPGGDAPIACTLTPDRMGDRIDDWHAALAGGTRTAIPGGVRVDLADGTDPADVARLTAAEHDCCRFFAFRLTADDRGIALEVTAPDDALDLVHALAGAPS